LGQDSHGSFPRIDAPADAARVMQRVLLVGCGDVALRVADVLRGRLRLVGLTRNADDVRRLRQHGIVPLLGDLDDRRTLVRLNVRPFAVVHLAPPPAEGRDDPRTRNLLAALASARIIPRHFVYLSTSGVYGDCAGAQVAETRPLRPQTPRARRREAAERRLRTWAARNGVALAILRVPGIYAPTRLPLERLKQRTPALVADEDVFTNHIHADDLAHAIVAALYRGRANRAYNASDDSEMKMGAWFDAVADAFHLPRPPRVSWDDAERHVAPMLLSFMSESRRLVNARMKRELRVRLRHPTPHAMLAQTAPRELRRQLALPIG
jgi:nucleoside-diphosphate-sugar epimerase